ncbi:MAG: polymerase sigma factor, sigma-70 family [Bacteroidetes bacterium]|nr:polymerase sigma factor, sigma-70 family [Bacteroidota bacterium]
MANLSFSANPLAVSIVMVIKNLQSNMDIQQKLIDDCIGRDRKAEYELYKVTYSYLMSICIRYTRNQDKAKEVLNMGFFRILTNLDKYRPEVPFKAWIRRVMINTLINEYKKEKIHYGNMEYVEDYYETDKYADINNAMRKTDAEEIYGFIASLPAASQQVFNLYFVDGYKHKEIAEMLNISEGTSKWHLNAAREKLKELLKKNDQPVKVIYHGQ